jgi:Methyltransferase domain
MTLSKCLRCFWVMLVLGLPAPLWAQPFKKDPSTPGQEYAPEVGQPGKDVVWMPTANVVMDKMFEIVKLTPQDVLYDLGSGDGRVVVAAAKRGTKAVGIEYDPKLVALSQRNAVQERVSAKATFVQGDIFKTDFSRATVVMMFLLPELNLKMRPTLLELKPGTRVASNSFDMGDWKPDRFERLKGDCGSWCMAFLWIVPAKISGTWKLANSELVLTQQYQHFAGTMRVDGRTHVVANGKLDGDAITFTVGDVPFSGRVDGRSIKGTMVVRGERLKWDARRADGN